MNKNTLLPDDRSAAVVLGECIRGARRRRGHTISRFAGELGRNREWLNRIELGYSEFGEYKPPTRSELEMIAEILGDDLHVDKDWLLAVGDLVMADYHETRLHSEKLKRKSFGKLTQTEIIIGEKQIVEAITELIKLQPQDAIIRNTGVKSLGTYLRVNDNWRQYRIALGNFLAANPNALFKRLEYAATPQQLDNAKEADVKLSGGRPLEEVCNAKIKFRTHNPLNLHIIIGQHEAIMALPQTTGQSGANIALLVRDKLFVEALRVWYDEVMWDMPGESVTVDFERFDESFEAIMDMYGFSHE